MTPACLEFQEIRTIVLSVLLNLSFYWLIQGIIKHLPAVSL